VTRRVQTRAATIRFQAERKAGEFLGETDLRTGFQKGTVTLDALGLTKKESHRFLLYGDGKRTLTTARNVSASNASMPTEYRTHRSSAGVVLVRRCHHLRGRGTHSFQYQETEKRPSPTFSLISTGVPSGMEKQPLLVMRFVLLLSGIDPSSLTLPPYKTSPLSGTSHRSFCFDICMIVRPHHRGRPSSYLARVPIFVGLAASRNVST